ncbi:MAG TPA: phosphopantetheine-binding protein [Streptosporangiaceae bacterium]|jgi:acyl carrier protein|nr:phosphopantetheine-binding protein [Streptosporangiaceae bacterium]
MPAPDTVTAEDIAGLFRRILETPEVEPDSDFFDLGGDSLLATRVLSAVAREFGLELTITDFMDAASPGALAKLIRSTAA